MWNWLDKPKSPETSWVSGDNIDLKDTKTPVWNILSLRVNDNAIKNLLVLWKIEEALRQIENNYEIIDWNIFISYWKNENKDTSKISTIWEFKNIKNLRPQTETKLKTLIYFMKINLWFKDLEIKDVLKKISYFSSDSSIKTVFENEFKIIIHNENWFKLRKNHS